jgi:hypothetical protein
MSERNAAATMLEEAEFLRPLVIRLRGVLPYALTPEIRAILQEVIMHAEERLDALNAAKLREGRL